MSYYDYDDDLDFLDDYDFEDYEPKKKGKGKLIAIIVAGVLAVAAAVGTLAVVFKHKSEQTAHGSYIQQGLVMYEEPEIRLTEEKGIRFKASVTPELKKEVERDKNKSFGMVIAPLNYFLRVDVEKNAEGIDWISTFADEKMTVLTVDNCAVLTQSQADGTPLNSFIQGSLTNVTYENTNLEFAAIAYVKITDGTNESYKYASYADGHSYKTQARSLAYLAAEALNDNAVNYTHYSSADVTFMQGVINNSVDHANGLNGATNDGSRYEVTLSETEKTLQLGKQFTLKAEVEESVKLPIWWHTDDASVVSVKNGVITAHGIGTATVSAYIAGEKYSCTVTVKKVVETETNSDDEQTGVA